MAKVSKEGVVKVLTHVTLLAVLVIGASAAQQDKEGCCGVGGGSATSGGDGGDGAGGSEMGGPCFDYGQFDGSTPTVSFKNDVVPIFRKSCGLDSACHGSQMGPAGQPYLGPALGPTISTGQLDQIYMENVNATSAKASGMKIVEPFSPKTSFLMHKMDNTLTCVDVKCDVDCGVSMPKAQVILSPTERDTVRRWIAQGADNN